MDLENPKFDKKDLTFGQMGINRFSAINVEIVESELAAMAMETIKIIVQPYIKMGLVDEELKTGIKDVEFDTDKPIKDFLEHLKKQVTEDPIDKKFLILLDKDNIECDETKPVKKYTDSNNHIKLDYSSHFVLQFATLDVKEGKEEPQYKFKFVTMKDTLGGLIPMKWKTAKPKLITIEDVLS